MKKGFTLMELLVYVGIFAIAAGLLTGVLFTVLRVQQRESSSTETTQQLNFVMQTIQRLVKESSVIIVNSTLADVDNDATIGTSQARLVLRMKDSGGNPVADRDPIIIWRDSSANIVKMSEGLGSNQKNSDLTNNRVIADNLAFTKFTQYPGHDTVSIDMQLTYNSNNPQEKISRSLRSAIARVSAATFDSDLLPGGTYNYNLGQSGSPWKTLYMADGSASNPSYTFSNDTTLGLFKVNGSSTIGFSTQGLERMRINSSGNVGIGTASPATGLHILNNTIPVATAQMPVLIESTTYAHPLIRATNQAAMNFLATSYGTSWGMGLAEQAGSDLSGFAIYSQPKTGTYPTINSRTNRLVIDTSGNVGIGTTAPGAKLELFSNSGEGVGLLIHQTGIRYWDIKLKPSDDKLYITDRSAGADRLVIDNTGNVGIGTTAPGSTLDVVGTVSIFRVATPMTLETVYTADTDLLFMCNLAGGTFTYILCNSAGSSIYSQNALPAVNQAGCSAFARKGETYSCSSPGMSGSAFGAKVYKLGR